MVAFVGGEGIEYINVPMYIFSDIENSLPQHPSKGSHYRLFIIFAFSYISYVFDIYIYISIKNATTLHFVAAATISSSSFS